MELYVMRHGPAEEQADSGLDADRALTPAGRERVRSVATALWHAKELPQAILTSPLTRSIQTAEGVASVAKLAERTGGTVFVRRELAPGGNALGLVTSVCEHGLSDGAALFPNAHRVMIVGHEPDLSELLTRLLGHFARAFEKAMVACITVQAHGTPAALRFVLDPKTTHLMHDDED